MKLSGIQFRLLLLGIVPTFLLLVILALSFIQDNYLDLENAIKEKGQITVNQLAISSIYGVFSGNKVILNEISSALLNEPDMASVVITDHSGKILALSQKAPLPNDDKLIFFQHPITISKVKIKSKVSKLDSINNQQNIHQNKKIGTVKIALSLVNTHKKQQSYLINSFALICLGLFSTTLLAIRLSKSISSPIIKLTTAANNLANGKMSACASGSTISEINDLCQSFNFMAIDLQKTQSQLEQKIEIAVEELNDALISLEEKNQSLEKTTQLAIHQNKTKSSFLAQISHEIRTPMNGVLGFSELLTKSELSPQQLDQAQLIKLSATSLLTIVNEILDYSSLETGHFNINITSFNLRETIENSVNIIFPTSKAVQVIIDIENDIPNTIASDPIRLQQVITNLLGNACKFTKQGYIIIRFRILKPNSLFISISDTGAGIHKGNITHLFQPFLQAKDNLFDYNHGTGLGLSISKNIVERLGGSIGVSSIYSKGSCFWINLPITYTNTVPVLQKQQTIVIIDSFTLRRNAFTKQLAHLGYKTISFISINEYTDQIDKLIKNANTLIFYAAKADKNEIISRKLLHQSKSPVILITNRKSLSSANTLSLPCRSSYLDSIITAGLKPKAKATKTIIKQTAKSSSVFAADDNEVNRLLLQSQLKSHCRNITLAENGKSALSYLQKNKYDLILLDLQMPYFTGLEIIKLIKKKNEVNKDTPIIAITAHAHNQQRISLIKAGFDECLIKPILMEQLQEILNLWLPIEPIINIHTDSSYYFNALLNRSSGNKTLVKKIFIKLFAELKEQIQTIEQALNANDLVLAEDITHLLHGSVVYCDFERLSSLAKELEINLLEQNTQSIMANFQDLKTEVLFFLSLKESIMEML